jgi:hypothetical protein
MQKLLILATGLQKLVIVATGLQKLLIIATEILFPVFPVSQDRRLNGKTPVE